MKRYFGCHVSCAGGLPKALANGRALEVNTIQIHPSPPQKWNSTPFPPGHEDEYLKALPGSGIERVFFHAIYLINLANPDPRNTDLSRKSLLHDMDLLGRIGGAGLIFHVGSLKDEPDEEVGYHRAAASLNWILEHAPANARILMEVSAGSGKVIGDLFEDLAAIYHMVEDKSRCGFALDTQHMWASGYDVAGDLEGLIKEVETHFTLDKVWAIHLNDSKTELGSRKDRHENLGEGLIGEKGIKAFFTHPKLVNIPMILETPAMKELELAKGEVQKLHAYLGK